MRKDLTGEHAETVMKAQSYSSPYNQVRSDLSLEGVDVKQAIRNNSGLGHTVALDVIMSWIRNQQFLNAEDRDTLVAYVSKSKPESLTSGEWQERVNEILNFLRTQPGGVPGLADLLLHMVVNDPDPVIRMYALQHISMWIPDEQVAENRASMIAMLKRLAETQGDPLAGSAVLFLDDLSRNPDLAAGEKVTDEVIETHALQLAADANAKPDVRICALHACVARGMRNAAPTARLIAADSSLMIPLRKAAIYSLGELGDQEDKALLESIARSSQILAAATTPAIKRLKH